MDEENIFMIWFETRNLSKSTKTSYKMYIKQYAKFTNKTIPQLYKEALEDEKKQCILTRKKVLQ